MTDLPTSNEIRELAVTIDSLTYAATVRLNEIHELAALVSSQTGALAAELQSRPRTHLRDQITALRANIDALTRLVRPAAPTFEDKAIALTPDQARLLLDYAEVDRAQRAVADAGLKPDTRQRARAELVRQNLINDHPHDGPHATPWLTFFGWMIANALECRQRLIR